jgi:hypothetical protein
MISKDDGQRRKEENLDRKIIPSLTPLFAALEVMEPAYSLLPISLVTDRNSLRKLFDFVSGTRGVLGTGGRLRLRWSKTQ